jgi:2,5-diketo-D-gluconate reductase B
MGSLSASDVRTTGEQSLRTLGAEYVDLLLVHWPNESIPMAETLGELTRLQEEGKVRHIGVSNYTMRHMRAALEICATLGVKLFCNQVEYHLGFAATQARMRTFLAAHGAALIAYSPLGRGKWPKDETLQGIGRRYAKSASQVALVGRAR